ncbi:hypothetical protein [Phytomonospora endophytica]|uniref:Uncharacterized protein n=1 Tax=Phytomonospora endophytica TaxID=714109 RepID=A0A841FYK6_9ACTN|nr:hypothetical protein [Phytomonospora endophytica]MBB6038602.1 hypothetical protein [Phytomonospora endophytica]GIG69255.1 hypothetical protein Pen01_55500 [Phytomonospora endophytica]
MTMKQRGLGVLLVAMLVLVFPFAAHAAESGDASAPVAADGHLLAGDQGGHGATAAPSKGSQVTVQLAWYYYISSSCSGYENSIVAGANYWGGGVRTASSGTPVSCTPGYVSGCGGSNVVGCNWNQGGRIALSTMVRDFALLSAHEFGHNWYGHSASGCANWNSAYDVMKTMMC